ncbi:MAG: dethiobiotin synthase [Nitrospinales bacterium]
MTPKGYFITGTDTGVGKTVVTACLLSLFRERGLNAGVMKPLETGVEPGERSDAEFLLQTAGLEDRLADVSPYRFRSAASPYLAAQLENRRVEPGKIIEAFRRLTAAYDPLLVEGIGGLLAPIASGYLVADLASDLGLPLIVVSRFSLGTINHTLLTLETAKARGIEVRGVIFNHLDSAGLNSMEERNPGIVQELSGVRVLGACPFIVNVSPKSFTPELLTELKKNIDLDFPRKL